MSGLCGMRVDLGEVELSGDQDGFEAHITAGLALGGLEQAVERLQEAIGLARLGPCNDAVEMLADHARDLLHWLDLGSHDV